MKVTIQKKTTWTTEEVEVLEDVWGIRELDNREIEILVGDQEYGKCFNIKGHELKVELESR